MTVNKPKFCVDCAHFAKWVTTEHCLRLGTKDNDLWDLVDGSVNSDSKFHRYAELERANDEACGKDAVYFQPKDGVK